MDLIADLRAMADEATTRFAEAADAEAVEAVRIDFLGRQGRLKEATKAFGALDGEGKRTVGPVLGETKTALTDACEAAQARVAGAADDEPIDLTEPTPDRYLGGIHPISAVAAEVERVFVGLGFDVIDGPHVEQDRYNFSLLNIPDDHPARDSQDTFWLDTGLLLRTHTSAVQSRTYEAEKPPLRKVVVGKVFRYEEVDATHDNTFTQVEGFIVDTDIDVTHLVGTLRAMIGGVLRRDDVEVRLRPSYFPFVEPGFEVDVRLPGAGVFDKWVELLGCGLIHPQVLRKGGIDPDVYSGFAFGMGLERLAMIRHGINDIRLFNGGDLRGLRQFA